MTAEQLRTFRAAVKTRRALYGKPINDVTMPLYRANRVALEMLDVAFRIHPQGVSQKCAAAWFRVHHAVTLWSEM
jgi:hypothetical protein